MTVHPEGQVRVPRLSARPRRLRSTDGSSIAPDLILALITIGLALAIITDPPLGPIDGRHLLACAALTALLIRTTRAARR